MKNQLEKLGIRYIENGVYLIFVYGDCIYSMIDSGGGRWDVALHDRLGWGAVTYVLDASSIGKMRPRPGFLAKRNGARFEHAESATPNRDVVKILSSQNPSESLMDFVKKDKWRSL